MHLDRRSWGCSPGSIFSPLLSILLGCWFPITSVFSCKLSWVTTLWLHWAKATFPTPLHHSSFFSLPVSLFKFQHWRVARGEDEIAALKTNSHKMAEFTTPFFFLGSIAYSFIHSRIILEWSVVETPAIPAPQNSRDWGRKAVSSGTVRATYQDPVLKSYIFLGVGFPEVEKNTKDGHTCASDLDCLAAGRSRWRRNDKTEGTQLKIKSL